MVFSSTSIRLSSTFIIRLAHRLCQTAGYLHGVLADVCGFSSTQFISCAILCLKCGYLLNTLPSVPVYLACVLVYEATPIVVPKDERGRSLYRQPA